MLFIIWYAGYVVFNTNETDQSSTYNSASVNNHTDTWKQTHVYL